MTPTREFLCDRTRDTTTAFGNTIYTDRVAKVMISIPDDLLERFDAHAQANRETRSGCLRRLIERELEEARADRRQELEDILGPPKHLGGNWAKRIREDRESH
jgi:Ribbon-helix-helix protein, copG family